MQHRLIEIAQKAIYLLQNSFVYTKLKLSTTGSSRSKLFSSQLYIYRQVAFLAWLIEAKKQQGFPDWLQGIMGDDGGNKGRNVATSSMLITNFLLFYRSQPYITAYILRYVCSKPSK